MGGQHRQQRGQAQQRTQDGKSLTAVVAVQQARPDAAGSHHSQTQQRIEHRDFQRGSATAAQQRDDEGHVTDIAQAELEIGRQCKAELAPAEAVRLGCVAGNSVRRSRFGRRRALPQLVQPGPGQQQADHGQQAHAAQQPPGRLPAVRLSGAEFQRQRHPQGRAGNAPAGAAVVQAQQQTAMGRCVAAQARCQQPAADKQRGAQHTGQQAQRQQRGGVGEQAGDGHQDAGQQRARQHDAFVRDMLHQTRHQ